MSDPRSCGPNSGGGHQAGGQQDNGHQSSGQDMADKRKRHSLRGSSAAAKLAQRLSPKTQRRKEIKNIACTKVRTCQVIVSVHMYFISRKTSRASSNIRHYKWIFIILRWIYLSQWHFNCYLYICYYITWNRMVFMIRYIFSVSYDKHLFHYVPKFVGFDRRTRGWVFRLPRVAAHVRAV